MSRTRNCSSLSAPREFEITLQETGGCWNLWCCCTLRWETSQWCLQEASYKAKQWGLENFLSVPQLLTPTKAVCCQRLPWVRDHSFSTYSWRTREERLESCMPLLPVELGALWVRVSWHKSPNMKALFWNSLFGGTMPAKFVTFSFAYLFTSFLDWLTRVFSFSLRGVAFWADFFPSLSADWWGCSWFSAPVPLLTLMDVWVCLCSSYSQLDQHPS